MVLCHLIGLNKCEEGSQQFSVMEGGLTLMLGEIMINELKTEANASELQLCNEI